MPPIISISDLTKTYASGLQALKGVNLAIRKGEIFALLGPNGAGKTMLIRGRKEGKKAEGKKGARIEYFERCPTKQ